MGDKAKEKSGGEQGPRRRSDVLNSLYFMSPKSNILFLKKRGGGGGGGRMTNCRLGTRDRELE